MVRSIPFRMEPHCVRPAAHRQQASSPAVQPAPGLTQLAKARWGADRLQGHAPSHPAGPNGHILSMRFEWDPVKAAVNLLKHDVTFEEAESALGDVLAQTGRDPDHSLGEARYVTFGVSSHGRLLVVAHTERDGTIRIMSARQATRRSGGSMKKVEQQVGDELRPEYQRSDFGELVRGKYAQSQAVVASPLAASTAGAMELTFECGEQADGRWLAGIPQLPGVMAYGATAVAALAQAQVLALRLIAERIEHGLAQPLNLRMSIPPGS